MVSWSPLLISLAGFVRAPFRCTLPPETASMAKDRVLKKRAAQSHLSSLTFSPFSCMVIDSRYQNLSEP